MSRRGPAWFRPGSRSVVHFRSAVFALAVYLNCSPIYVVNRDDNEVEAMLADFKKNETENFHPEMLHVKTPEQASKLPAPAYMYVGLNERSSMQLTYPIALNSVAAIPDYPPSTEQEKLARATFEAILALPQKGQILEMCYNPRVWSDVAEVSKQNGWHVITGEIAMIWQGIEQQKIWLGCVILQICIFLSPPLMLKSQTLEDLPIKETLEIVSAQVKSDTETGADPPQQ